MSRTVLFAGAAVLLAAGGPVAAQTSADITPPSNGGLASELGRDTFTVGIGAAYLPDYDGSNDYRVVPAPVALGTYKGYSFTLLGNRLSVNLIKAKRGPVWNIEAGPIGVVDFNRTTNGSIDDVRVKRLPERSTAIELGGYVGISKTGVITSPYDTLTFTTSVRYDVSGNNKSYVVTPSLTYLTPLSTKAAVGLTASGSYVGTKYARYYYGVTRADSVASGLPIFTPRHDWNNYTVGGFATYSITGDLLHGFKVIAGGTYSRTQGPSANSPLTTIAGSRNQFIGAAGVAYTF